MMEINPEDLKRLLFGAPKMKRGRKVIELAPDERARKEAILGLILALFEKKTKLELELEEAKLKDANWWNDIKTTHKLGQLAGIQYDEDEGAIYELVKEEQPRQD